MASLSQSQIISAERTLYQRSFYDFARSAWSVVDTAPLIDSWHIQTLCEHLQAVHEGKIKRLLINIPPGSGKSLFANVLFPAWLWTHSPTTSIISTSHKENLAVRDSMRTRRLIESHWYQDRWPTEIRDDQNSKATFANERFGVREACPFSSMTGSRGNVVIVDDPHSVKDAGSAAKRQTAVETFLEAIPSRLNSLANDKIIVIMQRLHTEDVSGAILDRPDLGYTHLCIPLLADGEDRPATPIGWKDTREKGEIMAPQQYPESAIKSLQASLGPYQFSGQYQQNPVPAGDGYFKREWFDGQRYKPHELPKNLNLYMTSDHAPGGTSKSDYNVFRIWGIDENKHLWLVDSFRQQCKMDVALGIKRGKDGKIALLSEGALPLIKKYNPLTWFAENDNTWSAIKSFVESAMIETNIFAHIQPLPTKGSGNKEGKAQAYAARASMKMVHLPAGPMGDDALEEYMRFPVGKNDDQVDADGMVPRAFADTETPLAFEPPPAPDYRKDYDDDHLNLGDSDFAWS